MIELTSEKIDILEYCRSDSQKYILAEIFNQNINNWIKKREIEKQFVLRIAFKNLKFENYHNFDEIILCANLIPGDVQRDLRTFYDQFKKYGLEKKGKNSSLEYRWNPILKSETNIIIPSVARNLFKTNDKINDFMHKKNYKCEMCGCSKRDNETLRMAIDHWRAHSIYDIDNVKIAVLLCEKCNNIHHNFDASKIAVKYKDNISIIKNWINKELEIRKTGYQPNKDDLEQQKINIKIINDYYSEINELTIDFWKGLI